MTRRLGIDVRDYKVAKTGILTVLGEIITGLQKDADYELILIKPAFVIQGNNPIMKMMGHLDYFFWKQVRLPFLAKRRNCQYLLCNDYVSPYFTLGVKCFPIFHGLNFWEQPQHYNKLWRALFTWMAEKGAKSAAKILTVSAFTKSKLVNELLMDKDKIHILPLGAKTREHNSTVKDDDTIHERLMIKPNQYLLHVGVLEKRKNLVRLVRAFSLIPDSNLKLVLAGPIGPKKDMDDSGNIRAEISKHNLEDRVLLTGFLSDQELSVLYQNAYMYVLPSFYEGFGIPALEAFQYNIPLISSDRGALPEVVGEGGCYFDPLDENDIKNRILDVQNDVRLREKLVSNGRSRLKLYNWDQCILALKRVLTND